eukprot:350318-Chlamydomonas_euryale.AAC.18
MRNGGWVAPAGRACSHEEWRVGGSSWSGMQPWALQYRSVSRDLSLEPRTHRLVLGNLERPEPTAVAQCVKCSILQCLLIAASTAPTTTQGFATQSNGCLACAKNCWLCSSAQLKANFSCRQQGLHKPESDPCTKAHMHALPAARRG